MNSITPFCAVRANPEIAAKFSSESFEFYTDNSLKKILDHNPHSFLQLIKPNIIPNKGMTSIQRFRSVKKKYEFFKSKGWLLKDPSPGFYIKELCVGNNIFTGIVAAVSVLEYKKGRIKKHEQTLKSREIRFKNYLKETRFNAEPVLLAYKGQDELSKLIESIKQQKPTLNLNISELESQKLWYISSPELVQQISKLFGPVKHFYIADGHHRSASSVLLAKEDKNTSTDFFMAFLIPEQSLVLQEYNRILSSLNGLTAVAFLNKLKLKFNIKACKSFKSSQNEQGFSMYLEGQFYSLSLRSVFVDEKNPLGELDAYILEAEILKPLLGIVNPRSDKRLQYCSKKDEMAWIKQEVDNGNYAIGFGLNAPSLNQLKAIADANLTLPPKSTYIYPKLRSGMTIYEF